MKSIPRANAEALMQVPKFIVGQPSWQARPNHAGSYVWAAQLVDAAGVTIPGLSVALETRHPVVVDSCLYYFSLMQRGMGIDPRAYQLEVCPAEKRSHIGPSETLYGPHEHIGEWVGAVDDAALNCSDWDYCSMWFFRRCSITTSTPKSP